MRSTDLQLELLKWAQLAGKSRNPGIRRVIDCILRIPDEKERQTEALSLLRDLSAIALARGAEEQPFLPQPEPEELMRGELLLGHLEPLNGEPEPCPIELPLEYLLLHLLVTGPPYEGKSTYLAMLAMQLITLGVPVWIFDTVGEFAHRLAPLFGPDQLLILHWEDYRRNLFEGPSRISQETWVLQHMPNYERESMYWRDSTIDLFRQIVREVLESGQPLNARTFTEAFRKIPLNTRKRQDTSESLKRFVHWLHESVFWCESGFDMAELSQKSVVFVLKDCGDDLRLILVSDAVMWQRAARDFVPDRKPELVFIFDELSEFASKEAAKRADLGEPTFFKMLRQARKEGIPVILADQTYGMLHEIERANTRTKIIFQTPGDGLSVLAIARDLKLDAEEAEYLTQLSFPRRRALVQIPYFPRPFLICIPQIQLPSAGREEVQKRQQDAAKQLPWKPLPELTREEKQNTRLKDRINHEMEMYLGLIASNWRRSKTEHDEVMKKNRDGKWSRSKGTRTRQKLKDLGLLDEYEINKGTQGGVIEIIIPTDEGYKYLDSRSIAYKAPEGIGSYAHKWWQAAIAEKLRKQAWQTKIEQRLGDKKVDVGAIRSPVKVAYEVVWEDVEKELANLRDLEDGWDRIVFCVRDEDTREKLSRLIAEQGISDSDDRIEICFLGEFAPDS